MSNAVQKSADMNTTTLGIPILFYLNGRQITEDEILMEYTHNGKLYPYVGMGHTGLRVLAKVSVFFKLLFSFYLSEK